MRFVLAVMVCGLAVVPASARAQGNMLSVVERVSADDPARFACAHSGRDCEADWIKAVAWALYQIDPRWGLNMKRDNDSQGLSLDVVTFRLGPTDRHVRAYDICGACGSPAARPVWSDITNEKTIGDPGTARWVKPAAVGGVSSAGGGPPSPTPPSTVPAVDYRPLFDALSAKLDALVSKVDAVAALAVEARDAAKSAEFDAREVNAWRMAVEPFKPAAIPCLVGRVPKPFGGSSEVRFCPAEP